MMMTTMTAQRHTDRLDRGLVVIKAWNANYLSWRRLTTEYYDVKYNVYRNGSRIATNYNKTNYTDSNSSEDDQYTIKAVVNGVEKAECPVQKMWKGFTYEGNAKYSCFLDIALAAVYDRDGKDVTANYEPNDAEMADLDGDGQLEVIVKRLNTADASTGVDNSRIYSPNSKQFVVLDAYDVNWQTGASTLLWRIDCGPNMVSMNSTELNIIAYDWDEDGRAEVVLRGADNMIVYGPDGKTELYAIGDKTVNTRNTFNTTNSQYAWTTTGAEYLIYMDGQTGTLYQKTDYPLKRLESGESNLKTAWGDDYGHRSTKHFLGAPVLDGRKASLFLGRGIYTRHKMIAMDLDRESHEWRERWRWNCNNSSSPWYSQGYHNFIVADVDEDGRDEIVYGSMVIDDNGKGLSTTGYGHGDAQHVGDFDPYRTGLEFFGCLEEYPHWGSNYRNTTTSEVYYKHTNPIVTPPTSNKTVTVYINGVKTTINDNDDGRALMANFSNAYPGSMGRSVGSGMISSVKDELITEYSNNDYIKWSDLNYRIYWDGDLCSEILNSPGTAREAKVEKPGTGRLFTSSGCNMNNDSKNNPCFQGDIIGDWREEIVVRHYDSNENKYYLRVYTTGIGTDYSLPTLWNDHQYRQAMVWQMMAYNQPPHLSYFLGEMEGITVAPPTLTDEGRTEIADGGTVSHSNDGKHLMICETKNMTVSVEDEAAPYILTVNTPTWVQGNDNNSNITTTTYTHTLTGGAFTGTMRLVKQGDGVLVLPNVTETYTGETNVWAGTLRFNGTMENSPVWLNRHATLETNGGRFSKSISADYGATIAVGSGGITVGTLTLNHGARLKLSVGSDGKISPVDISKLKLTTKTGDVWEQYGPKYLKPVIEFALSGSLNDGTYFIGNVGEVSGSLTDDIILEGLDGVNTPRLFAENGKLFLIVGTGESTTCPPATFAVSGYQRTADGLLPIVSIDPGTFSYGGSEVTPTLTAIYNGTAIDLLTLYNEDYEQATDASAWTTKYATLELTTGDATFGKYISVIQGGGSGPRSAYSRFYSKSIYGDCKTYAISFDAFLHHTHGDYDPNELIIFGEGASMPISNQIFSSPNYIFKLTGGKNYSGAYTVAGTAETYTIDDTWCHYLITVDKENRTVTYTITNSNNAQVGHGTYTISDEAVSLNAQGIEIGLGRAYSYGRIDNIRIYRTDGHFFTFTEPGTLTVKTNYTGCESGTATYTATEYIKIGDANMDGRVDITDVTAAISHIAGQTPATFCKEAADMDGNGTVEAADLRAIVNLIVGIKQ